VVEKSAKNGKSPMAGFQLLIPSLAILTPPASRKNQSFLRYNIPANQPSAQGTLPFSIIQRLRAAEVGEEVSDLLRGEVLEEAFGHEGFLLRDHFFDLIAGQRDVLPVHAP